jgi:hypothetical protein
LSCRSYHHVWNPGPDLVLVPLQLASCVAAIVFQFVLQRSALKSKRIEDNRQYLKVQSNFIWTWQEGKITTSPQYRTSCTRVPFIHLVLQLLGNSRVIVCLRIDVHWT